VPPFILSGARAWWVRTKTGRDRAARRPPAFPAVVGPGAADGAEHISAEDPGADVLEALFGHFIVDAGFAAVLFKHAAEDARREEPFHELGAADAERVLEVLVGPAE